MAVAQTYRDLQQRLIQGVRGIMTGDDLERGLAGVIKTAKDRQGVHMGIRHNTTFTWGLGPE